MNREKTMKVKIMGANGKPIVTLFLNQRPFQNEYIMVNDLTHQIDKIVHGQSADLALTIYLKPNS